MCLLMGIFLFGVIRIILLFLLGILSVSILDCIGLIWWGGKFIIFMIRCLLSVLGV